MWSPEEKDVLTAILDQLIPPNPDRGIPGAGALGVAKFLATTATRDHQFRTQVAALLRQVQIPAEDVTTERVRQLENDQPTGFAALLTETYKGYYSRPDMRATLGVGAHPVHPLGYDVPAETPEELDELTAPVRARGPVFLDPTGDQQ